MNNTPKITVEVNDPQGQPVLLWLRLVQRPGGLTVRIAQLVHVGQDGYPTAKLVNNIGMYGGFVNRLYRNGQWDMYEVALVCQRYFHQVSTKQAVAQGTLSTASIKATATFWRK